MRISKRVWVIVGFVILAVLIGIMFTNYSRQAGVRDDLNARLTTAQALMPVLATQKTDLENQLAQAQSSLDANKAKFPESIESIEYGEYLFEIADKCSVDLTSLSFPTPSSTTIGGVTYSFVSLSLPVSGKLDNIFAFIEALMADERFASAEVTTVNVNVDGGSATINLDIYGYEG